MKFTLWFRGKPLTSELLDKLWDHPNIEWVDPNPIVQTLVWNTWCTIDAFVGEDDYDEWFDLEYIKAFINHDAWLATGNDFTPEFLNEFGHEFFVTFPLGPGGPGEPLDKFRGWNETPLGKDGVAVADTVT